MSHHIVVRVDVVPAPVLPPALLEVGPVRQEPLTTVHRHTGGVAQVLAEPVLLAAGQDDQLLQLDAARPAGVEMLLCVLSQCCKLMVKYWVTQVISKN